MNLENFLQKCRKGQFDPEKILKDSGVEKFDKYEHYLRSVQSPENDVEFFFKTYKEIKGKKPVVFREDFCGTFLISCEWTKYKKNLEAIGIDLDPEPLSYGFEHYYPKLNKDQRSRLSLFQANVLDKDLPKADIVAALNFSYFIFKERKTMVEYFRNCKKGLKKDGILIADCFGGSACYEANEEETEHDGFSYFWDQDSYDPITNNAQFYIHFKRKGEKKREKVFSYDWRLWSIPELKDCMHEAGFKNTHVYWEGTTKDGEGDGEFSRATVGEECESWVAYIVAEQ